MAKQRLFTDKPQVVNIGLEHFTTAFQELGTEYSQLDWKPPAGGDAELIGKLFQLKTLPLDAEGLSVVDRANQEAHERLKSGQAVMIGVRPANEVFPGMSKNMIFHAGPPVLWQNMCGPMRAAFIGAIRYEGLAQTEEEAIRLMDQGGIDYSPNHHHQAVGPMTGIISYSMPVFVVENTTFGNRAYCTINEGLGKVMRFGANSDEVIQRLKWLETVLAPVLDKAIVMAGGVKLNPIIAQALAMGDEMHQRNVSASLQFFKAIAGELAVVASEHAEFKKIIEFVVKGNEQFFLNIAMAAAKSIMDPTRDIPNSTMVTCMSRNGVEFGIQVSGMGSRWFTAPCNVVQGMYFPGFTREDANLDMGDSTITECIGIGGMAMGCAPAVVSFVGAGSVEDAIQFSLSMGEIVIGRNPNMPMPNLDFKGVAAGIDICKVVDTGILPIINTGIAHKLPGIGQIGAGIVKPPMQVFAKALKAFTIEPNAEK